MDLVSIYSIQSWAPIGIFLSACGDTSMDYTIPTNTVQVPNTTGTVTDSGSV